MCWFSGPDPAFQHSLHIFDRIEVRTCIKPNVSFSSCWKTSEVLYATLSTLCNAPVPLASLTGQNTIV